MTVSAILKGPPDKYKRIKIYIRTSDGYSRKFKATQLKVAKTDWEMKKGLVKPSHPNYQILNSQIKKLIVEAEAGILNKEEYSDADFATYVTNCLNEWGHTKAWGTIKQLTTELNRVKEYKKVMLSNITPEWLSKYQQYLFSLGHSGNTVWKAFKFLRLITRKAYREKVIRNNPFDIFQMPRYKDPKKIYLSKSEVQKIDRKMIEKKCPPELKIAGTWFVIACYTGLRFSDLSGFNKNKIKDGRLIIYTAKTGELVSIKMNDKLKSLFGRVNFSPMPYTNTHYNRLLKAVGAYCEIDEVLTSHVSRHTCATMLASAGAGIEVTAKILGHSSIKTTSIYYKITGDRVDAEMSKLF